MRHRILRLVLVSIVFAGNPVFGATCDMLYSVPRHLEATPVGGVLLQDFNGDGSADLAAVVLDHSAYKVAFYYGDGKGQFSGPVLLQAHPYAHWLAAGDMNGDGLFDLAVTSDRGIQFYLSQGQRLFARTTTLKTGGYSLVNPLLEDFDRDGALDLAVAASNRREVKLFLGNGAGGFKLAQRLLLRNPPRWLEVSNRNQRSSMDLIVATGPSLEIYRVLPSGSFRLSQSIAFSQPIRKVVAAEFNREPGDDLVVVSGAWDFDPAAVFILSGASGTYSRIHAFTKDLVTVAVGDLNLDGAADLVSSDHDYNLSVWLNKGNGSFRTAIHYFVRPDGGELAVGDYNSDGAPDVVEAGWIKSIALVTGKGDGALVAQKRKLGDRYPYSIESVCVGDFNQDGFPDLASATWNLRIQYGRANGTFQGPVEFGLNTPVASVRAADLNNDGWMDAVTADDGHSITAALNETGAFRAVQKWNASAAQILAHDLNGDRFADVLAINPDLLFSPGRGDGTFLPATTWMNSITSAAAYDFNRDSKMDLALGTNDSLLLWINQGGASFIKTTIQSGHGTPFVSLIGGSAGSAGAFLAALDEGEHLYVYRIDANGTVTAGQLLPAMEYARAAGSADLNSDGLDDIYYINWADQSVSILLQRPDVKFELNGIYEAGYWPSMADAADFNRDGRPDMVVANDETGLSVLLSTPARCGMP